MYQRVLTLDGTPQCLLPSDVAKDVPLVGLILQPRGSNNEPIYVGNNDGVSSSDYMFRLEAGDAGIPPAPFILECAFQRYTLGSFWVTGTEGEILHIGGVTY